MSSASPDKKSWECVDCRVHVSFAAEASPAQPADWARDASGWHCLGCRREAAMNASTGRTGGTPSQRRRHALLEFELRRDPAASDLQIAKRAKCATSRVRPVREALRESGNLPA